MRGQGCRKCVNELQTRSIGTFIEIAIKVHGTKFSYDNVIYKGSFVNIVITCKIHGDFTQQPHHHLVGRGCPKCGFITLHNSTKLNTEEFIEKSKQKHGSKYSYDKTVYVGNNDKVVITCRKHGNFYQSPNNHMRGRGCPSCSKTYKQNKWLDSVGIPNDPKHREVSVRVPNRTRPIRVDGYDPKTNTVYEFNGDSWHGNPALFGLHLRGHVGLQKRPLLAEPRQRLG